MAKSTVTLRRAAAALGIPASTLSQLVKRESSLSAAVVGTGPRGSLQIDLQRLTRAWAQLQAPAADEEQLSGRARYDLARRRRLWWECCAAEQQALDTERSLSNAAEDRETLTAARAAVQHAARAWADRIGPLVAGLDQPRARIVLNRSITEALAALLVPVDARPAAPPPVLPSIAVPEPLPGLWELRAKLEACRGRMTQLQLQRDRGELLDAHGVSGQFRAAGRQMKDDWLRVGEQLALQARRLQDAESARTTALQALSAVSLI